MVKYKLDLLFTANIGEISFYLLKNYFVDIYKIEENAPLTEVIERYHNNQLKQLANPAHPREESQVEQ